MSLICIKRIEKQKQGYKKNHFDVQSILLHEYMQKTLREKMNEK